MFIPTTAPFSYLVNPDGRGDGYTKILTAPATVITFALPASVVIIAKILRVRYSINLAGQDAQGPRYCPNNAIVGDSVLYESYNNGVADQTFPASLRGGGMLCGPPNDGTSTFTAGEFTAEVPTGKNFRNFSCRSKTWRTSGGAKIDRVFVSEGVWDDTTTAITSVTLQSLVANNMLTGSYVIAYLEG